MDPYIRNFTVTNIKTETVHSAQETKVVLEVNNNYNNFKLVHFNIRSVMKNFSEIEIFLKQFDTKFDCIILTETWQVLNVNMIQLHGYTLIYNEAKFNQNDGTIIYIRNDIENIDYSFQKINETSVINLTFNINNKSYAIYAMYRPPSTKVVEFIESLQFYLQHQRLTNDYSIFVGDINIDILKTNLHSEEYLNIMAEFGFKSVINNCTRIQGTSQSCLDHIFIKAKFDIEDIILPITIHTNITDHFPVLIQLVTEQRKYNEQCNKTFIKYIQYDKLKQQLSDVDWADVYNSRDVEAATKKFLNIIDDKIKTCTKLVKIKNKMRKRKCWITNGIIKSIETRDKLFRQSQTEPSNINLKKQYLDYRNKLTALIKKTKINYFRSKIDKNKTCTKNLWSMVKEMCNSCNNQINIPKIYNEKNEIITNKIEICNTFNKIYSTLGKNMAEKIKINKNYREKIFFTNTNSMFLMPTNRNEVKNCILRLKPNKSPGADNIKSITLKNIAEQISETLAYIINQMFVVGYCPLDFKMSIVKPIYKNGNRMLVTNYRPISLITNFAKVFEMLLKTRLYNFIKKFKILSDNQFGFTEGKSTQDAIAELTKKIYHSLDKSKPSLCVFIDLAKAFDTVSHKHLLECLEDIGVRDVELKLFNSYLSDRTQSVHIAGTQSGFRTVSCGVPQGTVLGPILFLIYLNNLFAVESVGHIISFADDTAIYYEAETWSELKLKVERDLPKLLEWFNFKLLTLNVEKTLFLPFGLYKKTIPDMDVLKVYLGTELFEIKKVSNVKYLGIYIDCHLRWDVHVGFVLKKLRSVIHMFKYIKDILDINHLIILYKALVESHLTYGIIGWGGILNVHLQRLQIMQKRILKIIFDKPIIYSSDELFHETHIFDIRQLYFFTAALKVFSEKKDKINHTHQTRTNNVSNLPIVFMHTNSGQRSSTYLGPKIFNSIPNSIRNVNSKSIFKRELKNFIYVSRRLVHTLVDSNSN